MPEAESPEEEPDWAPAIPTATPSSKNIARLKKEYLKAGLPVISIYTKKKELLAGFHRDGNIPMRKRFETNDHDFGTAGSRVRATSTVSMMWGRSLSITALATTPAIPLCQLAAWWDQQTRPSIARSEKLLCRAMASRKSATQHLFKEDLQKLASLAGHRDPRGPLPALLLEVQSDSASPVPAFDPGLPRSDLPHVGDR